MKRLIVAFLVAAGLYASPAFAQQSLTIHNDEPALAAALALPVPTINVIPAHWSDVTCFVDFQAHWSTDTMRMRHTHFRLPCSALYNEVSGQVTTPFQFGLFQADGHINPGRFEGDLISNVIWDATGTSTPPVMNGDPSDGAFVTWSGVMTLDLRRSGQRFSAPPHGWFNIHLFAQTLFDDGTGSNLEVIFPLYSVLDPSQAESPADPSGPFPSTWPRKQLAIYGGVGGGADGSNNFWGAQNMSFRGLQPTFGTLIRPFTPEDVTGYMYAVVDKMNLLMPGGSVSSTMRVGENLHAGIEGTILASAPPARDPQSLFLLDPIPFTYDPRVVPSGANNFTGNWCVGGGPVLPDFPGMHMACGLLKIGVNTSNDGSVVPSPLVLATNPNLAATSSGSAVAVAYSLPAISGGTAPYVGPSCSPVSGSLFPVGVTPVSCQVSDSLGGTASSSFTVTVTVTTPPPADWVTITNALLQREGDEIRILLPDGKVIILGFAH